MRRTTIALFCATALALGMFTGCSQTPQPAAPPAAGGLKKMPADQQFSGFLKDYAALKPNPALGARGHDLCKSGQDEEPAPLCRDHHRPGGRLCRDQCR